MEERAALQMVLAPDAALVGLDDLPANRQPQSRSASVRGQSASDNVRLNLRFLSLVKIVVRRVHSVITRPPCLEDGIRFQTHYTRPRGLFYVQANADR